MVSEGCDHFRFKFQFLVVMHRKNYFHVAALKAALPSASAFSVCSDAAGYIIYQTTALLPSVVQEIKQKVLMLLVITPFS